MSGEGQELRLFADRLRWQTYFFYGLRRMLALATSEEEAAAWIIYLGERR